MIPLRVTSSHQLVLAGVPVEVKSKPQPWVLYQLQIRSSPFSISSRLYRSFKLTAELIFISFRKVLKSSKFTFWKRFFTIGGVATPIFALSEKLTLPS